MQIQKRLTLGIGVLFAMILLLGIQSVGYIRDLSKASVNIIADNYNSLRYASDMMTSLDSIEYDSAAMLPLLETLALQQKNITEADEFQATGALQQRIAMLQDTVTPRTIQLVRSDLYRIMELNMAAIQAKSRLLSDASEEAMWWLAITAVLCVLIAFVFLIRFPRGVVKPITMLKFSKSRISTTISGWTSNTTKSSRPLPNRSTRWPKNCRSTGAARSRT